MQNTDQKRKKIKGYCQKDLEIVSLAYQEGGKRQLKSINERMKMQKQRILIKRCSIVNV